MCLIASDDSRVVNRKDLEGNGCGLSDDTIPGFVLRY